MGFASCRGEFSEIGDTCGHTHICFSGECADGVHGRGGNGIIDGSKQPPQCILALILTYFNLTMHQSENLSNSIAAMGLAGRIMAQE